MIIEFKTSIFGVKLYTRVSENLGLFVPIDPVYNINSPELRESLIYTTDKILNNQELDEYSNETLNNTFIPKLDPNGIAYDYMSLNEYISTLNLSARGNEWEHFHILRESLIFGGGTDNHNLYMWMKRRWDQGTLYFSDCAENGPDQFTTKVTHFELLPEGKRFKVVLNKPFDLGGLMIIELVIRLADIKPDFRNKTFDVLIKHPLNDDHTLCEFELWFNDKE